MIYSRIAGTGGYLPEKVVTNKELEKTVDTTDEWIRERTGICRRHIAAEGETCSDMGIAAAEKAIEMAGIEVTDIDLIVVGTTTPDKVFPSTACIIQRRLGIKGSPAFDVQAACSGFMYALDLADRQIRTGGATTALVVLVASEEQGILSTHIHADGQYEELLHVPAGIAVGYDTVRHEKAFIHMKGNAVFKRAVATLGSIARETLAANGVDKHDVDWLIPHQANLRIILAAAKKLDLSMDRVVVTVDEQANTSSASVPLALDTAVRDGRIQRGHLLLMAAFGAGFTWGSALIRF